jgi:hypothetical protein
MRGKTSTGWFFGFKLHLIINDRGEILNFVFTQGNTDDRDLGVFSKLAREVTGKLFGDKGYISQKLFDFLFADGLHLFTKLRSNMKNQLMNTRDKLLLRKRAVIETVNDELKNLCQIEHSRHRSFTNFFTNLMAGMACYCFKPKQPSVNIQWNDTNQLDIFF